MVVFEVGKSGKFPVTGLDLPIEPVVDTAPTPLPLITSYFKYQPAFDDLNAFDRLQRICYQHEKKINLLDVQRWAYVSSTEIFVYYYYYYYYYY